MKDLKCSRAINGCRFLGDDCSCLKRYTCVYQVTPSINDPAVVDGYYIFPFECECGAEWTQKSLLPCLQVLAVCGTCGKETSYKVVSNK